MKLTGFNLVTTAFVLAASSASGQNVYFGEGGMITDSGIGCGDQSSVATVFGPITITGETGTEIEAVTLIGLWHTWAGDLDVTLSGPNGFSTHLIDRPGAVGTACGSASDFVASNTYEWSNDGTLFPEDPTDPIPSGDYFPTGELGFPSNPLPTGDLNGTWTLTIHDLTYGGAGLMADWGGIDAWSIAVVPEPSVFALVALGGVAALCRRRVVDHGGVVCGTRFNWEE